MVAASASIGLSEGDGDGITVAPETITARDPDMASVLPTTTSLAPVTTCHYSAKLRNQDWLDDSSSGHIVSGFLNL